MPRVVARQRSLHVDQTHQPLLYPLLRQEKSYIREVQGFECRKCHSSELFPLHAFLSWGEFTNLSTLSKTTLPHVARGQTRMLLHVIWESNTIDLVFLTGFYFKWPTVLK